MTVPFGGEIMPKVKKMMTSQNTSMTKKGMGNELCSRCSVSIHRTSAMLPLIWSAYDKSHRWASLLGESRSSFSWIDSSPSLGFMDFPSPWNARSFGQIRSIAVATLRRSSSRASRVSGPYWPMIRSRRIIFEPVCTSPLFIVSKLLFAEAISSPRTRAARVAIMPIPSFTASFDSSLR